MLRRHLVCVLVGVSSFGCGAGAGTPSTASATNLDANADANRLFELVSSERSRRGLPPAERYAEPGPLIQATRALRDGHAPRIVLDVLLQRLAHSESTEVRGWVLEGRTLEQVGMPPELFSEPDLTLALVAAQDPRTGLYVVCVVVVEEGPGADEELGTY